MASEDLLKKAVAAFNALSPEQQAEMLEEQRQSWVRGNVGLSRDERDMTSPMMRALKTVREENSAGRQAVKAWADSNTRPTPVAPVSPDATCKCGELVTVAWFQPSQRCCDNGWMEAMAWQEGEFSAPVVLRSQAVELLAAERAEKEIAERNRDAARENFLTMQKSAAKLLERAEKAEADNAALTARVKELRIDRAAWEAVATDIRKQAKALEAKLTAAEKALTEIASFTQTTDLLWWQERARAALGGKP